MPSSVVTSATEAIQVPTNMLSSLGIGKDIWPDQADIKNLSAYDHIVVGVGSAGSVVATRLAEDSNNTVLALEAGGDPLIIALLAGLFSLLPHTVNDYNYTSTFDPYAARSQNNFTMLTAGLGLGGSDTINHFLHIRGAPSGFDYWAEMTQDNSWKYENILKYFIKSERVDDEEIMKAHGKYHGTEGPMGITRQKFDDKVEDILKSFAEAGNPTVLDLNADTFIGYTQPQYMLADSIRQTPAYSYLKRVKNNLNLHVSKNTRVTKILFQEKIAVGIEAIYKDQTYIFNANKEVILCAGAFNTPQILMLSGIGPEDHLNSMNIPVKSNLPVGDNLMDQVSVTVVHKLKKYLLPVPKPFFLPPITQIPFPVMVATVSLNKSSLLESDYQSYNLVFAHDTPLLAAACRPVFGYTDAICDRWIKQLKSRDALYSIILNIKPKSRGTIRLRSTNPFDDPVITTNFLTEIEDLEDLVKYIKDFVKVGETSYFKNIGAELVGLDIPECGRENIGTDEYWKCYIMNMATSVFHSACTCPMGTVTDSKMKVKGFENLRIIDASVMPILPPSAPNAAVIMLAEKGADLIKSEYN